MSAGERPYFSGETLPPDALIEEFKREMPGAVVVHNAVPPGLLVVHNFLTPEQCRRIVGECGALSGQAGRVLSSNEDGGVASREVEQILQTLYGLYCRPAAPEIAGRELAALGA